MEPDAAEARPSRARAATCALVALAVAACGNPSARRDATVRPRPAAPAFDDAEELDDAAASEPLEAGPSFTPPTQVVALGTWVPIRREPRRDAPLVGYLRAGAVAAVVGMPVGRQSCPVRRDHPEGGWYRLAAGGFLCVGGALAQPWPARGTRRPVQPQLDAGMPYAYGIVYSRVNMYREPPTMEQLRMYEPWRFRSEEPAAGSGAPADGAEAPAEEAPRPRRPPVAAVPADSLNTGEPRLRDLRGERGGPVIRRLLSGMRIALDRTFRNHGDGDRYWRTQSGGFVRAGAVSPIRNVPTFRGVELTDGRHLPYAFAIGRWSYRYRLWANERGADASRHVASQTGVQLADAPPVTIGDATYYRTEDGYAVHARHARIALLRPPPEGTGPTERWIDIDLDDQILVAYEGPRPVFVTLVSTGLPSPTDPENNYETPAGSFRIRGKHVSTTMDGDTADDGPYSLEDVPWAQYFYESYALHGTFWHGNFGRRQSHGCVNLSPDDARWIFFFTEPRLPDGWHGVFSGDPNTGTRVELHHGRRPTPRRPTWRYDT